MTTPAGKTPEWLIERLALGELDEAAAADVRARLAAEGRTLEGAIGALALSNREILEELPPARIAAAVRGRAADAPRPRASWVLALPLALVGAAAFVLVARPRLHSSTTMPPPGGVALEDTTLKGGTTLHVYRRASDKSERLADGARAARGDLLQLAYRAAGEHAPDDFGALLSIDGRGQITVHWPDGDAVTAARLSHKGEIKLPSAYELDDAPAFERFFFVTSEAPFAMTSVVDAARALAARPGDARARALPLPPSLRQQSLTLDKPAKETP